MASEQNRFEIVIIDDNPAEAHVLEAAFRDCQEFAGKCTYRLFMDSRELIPFLRSAEMASYRPNLFILDYKMPINGGLTLVELKGDPLYRHIPVLVLTGTMSPDDICEVYRRGANCCYHKPFDLNGYRSLATLILEHWLSRICMPVC